jgi:hypothetical protein
MMDPDMDLKHRQSIDNTVVSPNTPENTPHHINLINEILFIAPGKYITTSYSQLSAKKKYLTSTNLSQNFFAFKNVPKSVQLYVLLKICA